MKNRWKQIFVVSTVVLLHLLQSCASVFTEDKVLQPAKTDDAKKHVVVIKSSDNPLFDKPIQSFSEQINHQVTVVTLSEGATPGRVITALEEMKPDLIVSLGIESTYIVHSAFENIPVIFTMVPKHERFDVAAQTHLYGISLESPVVSDFVQFKLVLPELTNVLVFYDPEVSKKNIEEAERELGTVGISLLSIPIRNSSDLAEKYTKYKDKADGIWLQIDPAVMNEEAFNYLKENSYADKIPLLTSLSDQFAEAGALASVSLDFTAIGSQAANLAMTLLDKQEIANDQRIQSPIGGRLTLNLDAAKKMGIEIPNESLPLVSRIIAETTNQKSDVDPSLMDSDTVEDSDALKDSDSKTLPSTVRDPVESNTHDSDTN